MNARVMGVDAGELRRGESESITGDADGGRGRLLRGRGDASTPEDEVRRRTDLAEAPLEETSISQGNNVLQDGLQSPLSTVIWQSGTPPLVWLSS